MYEHHPRPALVWRVAIIPEHNPQPLQGRSREVSLQNAGILVPHPLPLNARCKLIFEIPAPDRKSNLYVEASATVTYSTLIGGQNEYRTGFRLLDIPPEHRIILEKELKF
jgi:hypothetical protein